MAMVDEFRQRQRARNRALLLALLGVAALFFLMTLARLGAFG
jgi:amino acid transporter